MTPQEAFKFGFFARCAAEGLDEQQTYELTEKIAGGPLLPALAASAAAPFIASSVMSQVPNPLPLLAGALAIPPAVGGGLAYMKNTMVDPNGGNTANVRNQELIDTYARLTDQLKRQSESREFQKKRKRSGRAIL